MLLFDGVCHLCQGSVKFVLRHERDEDLLFCPLQSEAGKDLLRRHGFEPGYGESLVVFEGGKALARSDAARAIAARLRSPWSWARALGALPRGWRDRLYDAVARRRYRWFGKDEAFCFVPDARLRARLLEDLPAAPTR